MHNQESKYSLQNGYILVEHLPGHVVDLDKALSRLAVMEALGIEHGTNKVYVRGTSAEVRLSTLDLHQLAKAIAATRLQMAFCVPGYNDVPDDERFLENTAVNRGGRVAFFDNEAAAMTWLGLT